MYFCPFCDMVFDEGEEPEFNDHVENCPEQ